MALYMINPIITRRPLLNPSRFLLNQGKTNSIRFLYKTYEWRPNSHRSKKILALLNYPR